MTDVTHNATAQQNIGLTAVLIALHFNHKLVQWNDY